MKKVVRYLILTLLATVSVTAGAVLTACNTKEDTPHTHNYIESVTAPTCTDAGYTKYTCDCGESYKDKFVSANGHTPKAAVKENEVPATCTSEGSYNEVVRCSVCNEVISSTPKTTEKLDHTPKAAVRENEVPATCTSEGSYNEVVRCSVCNEIISSTPKTTEKLPHTPKAAVKENEVPATCTKEGSYNEVVRCSVCNEVISSTPKTTEKLDHTPQAAVKENEVPATCTSEGSYNEVVRCSVCNEVISSTPKTTEKLSHTPQAAVRENEVPATCTNKGSYNEVVRCSVCNEVISSTPKTTAKAPHNYVDGVCTECGYDINVPHTHQYSTEVTAPTCTEKGYTTYTCNCGDSYKDNYISANGHTPKAAVKENEVPATCTSEGSYNEVVRCSVCNEIISSTPKTTEKLSHTPKEAVKENEVPATCTKEGSYDEVVYCSVCNEVISSTPKTTEKAPHNYLNGVCTECEKPLYDLTQIKLEDKTVPYDGTAHSLSIDGTLPNGLSVVYDNNGKINAGVYTVTATVKDETTVYKTLTAKLTVEKRELNITFSGETDLVYNGNAQKTITATAVNLVNNDTVDISITYSGEMIESGIYTATATIAENLNYKLTQNNTITVTISRSSHKITFKQEGQPDIVKTVLDLADFDGKEMPKPAPINGYKVAWEEKDLSNITQDITVNAVKTPIVYKILYELNGGMNNITNPQTYTIESETISLATPVKLWATFSGWYTTKNHLADTRVTVIESGSYGDITLYAYWLEYRITSATGFDIDMEQEPPLVYREVSNKTENIDLNDKITVSADCTWSMYRDFEGNNELKLKAMSLTVGHNYAYIIVYHPDGQHFSRYKLDIYRLDTIDYAFMDGAKEHASGTIEEKSKLSAPEINPQKDYYNFAGWVKDNESEICKFPYTVTKNIDIETTAIVFNALYTPIEYEITYHPNGGTIDTQKTHYNFETQLLFDTPVKTGYDFAGWYLTEDLSGEAYGGITIGNHGNIDLYAKWTLHTYGITYHLNNGTNSADNPASYTIETPDITFAKPTRTGYTFGGWFSDEGLTSAVTTLPLGSYGDIQLWAKWTPIVYTITYELDGGTLEMAVNDYNIEKVVTLDIPQKEYYGFAGWYDNAEFSGQRVTGIAVGNHGNRTFYAKWTPIVYTITYELNGGTLETTVNDYHIEKAVTFDTPERTGYDFAGWYDNAEFSGEAVTGIALGNHDDKTFYAKWTLIVYTITYESNGGTLETAVNDYNIEKAVTFDNPTKDYYDFKGWYDNAELIGEAVTGIAVGNHGNRTFYAKWTPIVYTITYQLEGGEAQGDLPASFTVEDLPLDLKLRLPYKENYFFGGWYSDSGFNNVLARFTEVGNKTVYVKWIKAEEYFTYSKSPNYNYYIVTGYNGSFTDITIPSVHNNVAVKQIGSSAFSGCSTLTSVIIPDSITTIGDSAFEYCSGLTSVTIGNGVTSIGTDAFNCCFRLVEVYNKSSLYIIAGSNSNSYVAYYAKNVYTAVGGSKLTTDENGFVIYNGNTIVSYVGTATEITIPNTVTTINQYAFYNCSNLTNVTIPDSVKSIGECAFYDCYRLIEVYNKSALTITAGSPDNGYIGYYAKNVYTTADGSKLNTDENGFIIYDGNTLVNYVGTATDISIPNTVTTINKYAFYNCSSLTSITIPNSVTSIGYSAFYGCDRLTSIDYGGTIEQWLAIDHSYTDLYLRNAGKLLINSELVAELVIPDGVTSIGDSAFRGCSSLTSVTIPDGVTSIGDYAFSGCSGLTSITIPDGVTSIGDYAFSGCSNLETVYWNATACTSAGSSTYSIFSNCTKLTTVIIGDNVTKIPSYAFKNCSSLTSITIGNGVTSIGNYAFSNCSNLETIYWNATACTSAGSVTYSIFSNCTKLTTVIIGDNVTTIPSYAFDGCSGLTSITIPNSVTSIGDNAFKNCSSLTSITIGNGVTSIGNWAFCNCKGLTSITIPDSVTSISDYAFRDCYRLVEVYNKSSLTITAGSPDNGYIGYYAKNVYTTADGSKLNTDENGFVIYGGYMVVNYVGTATEVIIPNNVTIINQGAFYNCKGLTSITIPDSVTSIGNWAFCNCKGLTSMTLPNSVTSIGNDAFYGCSGLTSITIGNGVTSIGNDAFSNCSNLETVYWNATACSSAGSHDHYIFSNCTKLTTVIIGNNVTTIPSYAFYCCDSLTSITIPDSVTSIGDSAFSGCSSLTSITIPDSVTSIGRSAFWACINLTSITIGNGVTSIGDYAFMNCIRLTRITIGKSVTSIGNYAFDNCGKLSSVYYKGTAKSWSNISIGDYNDSLINATRYYN